VVSATAAESIQQTRTPTDLMLGTSRARAEIGPRAPSCEHTHRPAATWSPRRSSRWSLLLRQSPSMAPGAIPRWGAVSSLSIRASRWSISASVTSCRAASSCGAGPARLGPWATKPGRHLRGDHREREQPGRR